MSIPSWWSDSLLEPGDSSITIADVETGGVGIITEARLRLVTNGNWTEPSANLFQSPLDSDGRFFDILFTRIDADTMEVRVRDYLAATLITRRFDINVGPATTVIEFYWGNSYLFIWSRRATPESFHAMMLDPTVTGGVNSDQSNRLVASAQRTTAGSATLLQAGQTFAFDNGVAATDLRARSIFYATGGSLAVYPSLANRELFGPMTHYINQGGVLTAAGAAPGMAICPIALAFDTVKNLPVDTGTKLAFVVLPLVSIATYGGRGMIRKPSADP